MPLLDRLAADYARGEHRLEAGRARDEFFERAGKVFDDDGELFESRMAAFVEWFVLERGFRGGPPPVRRALQETASTPEQEALSRLATTHRSLFDVTAVDPGRIELLDLIAGARFAVGERRSTVGFERGDLCEARLIWNGQAVTFGKTFLFHPREARPAVLDLVKASRARAETREDLLFHLARLHLRWHRNGHLGAVRVYREEV